MKIKMKPMASWTIWAGGLSLIMGTVTYRQLIAGFQADETGMSVVIASLFVAGLVISFFAAKQLNSECNILTEIKETNQLPQSQNNEDLASVFQKLDQFKIQGKLVSVHPAIDTYHSKHNSHVRSVSIMAALVISMGLLGTVIGLIMSISGLGAMVENIGLSRTTMMEALKTTVSGMGTAFYTTFFGALGGLILRAVAVSQLNSLSELCAEAAEYADNNLVASLEDTEEELNLKVSKLVISFGNMQKEIEAITTRVSESFETTMMSFGDALAGAGNHAMEATKESIAGMSEKLGSFGDEIGQSIGTFNESVTQAGEELHETFSSLNKTIDTSSEGVSESFDGLNDSVKQAGDSVTGSLADFKLSIDGTTIELNEAVGELHSAISQATGEMVTMAKAKLDTEATEIAGQLSIAADAIQTLLQKKGDNPANQQVI